MAASSLTLTLFPEISVMMTEPHLREFSPCIIKSPDVLRGEKKPDGTYEYETQVTYWMPFNGGIGFHDATWQAYFGGDRYTYAGSHGCINMPLDAAATLYSIIDTNVPIVCFY